MDVKLIAVRNVNAEEQGFIVLQCVLLALAKPVQMPVYLMTKILNHFFFSCHRMEMLFDQSKSLNLTLRVFPSYYFFYVNIVFHLSCLHLVIHFIV